MATSKPDMSIIWATAGQSVRPSDAKIQEGWRAEKPPYQNENWIQERQDQYLKHLDERGVPEWSNGTNYLKHALAWHQERVWRSDTTNNLGNVPLTGGGFWSSPDYLQTSGGAVSGLLSLLLGLDITGQQANVTSREIRYRVDNILRASLTAQTGNTPFSIGTYNALGQFIRSLNLNENGTITYGNALLWTNQNDGANTGLDADLLDGKHAQAIIDEAIAGVPPPAQQAKSKYYFTTSGNIVIPSGYTWVLATVVGGGGGGSATGGNVASSGGDSTVSHNNIVARSVGGKGGSTIPGTPGESTITIDGVIVGASRAWNDPARDTIGGQGFYGFSPQQLRIANIPGNSLNGGGGTGGFISDFFKGSGGSSSSPVSWFFNLTGDATIAYTVGQGGNGSAGSVSGGKGGDGFVMLDFF